jgi:zinc transport system permease protein
MDFFGEIFQYRFLTNALAASVLAGIVCGLVGTYVMCRRLVFLSGGITHSSFGGIGIAYYLGLNPIIGALVFAVISALGIEWAADRGRMREDSAIGIFWSVGMAIGIIFIYMTPGYAPNLMSFLFGSILTVTSADIIALAGLAMVITALFIFCMRPVFYVAFDREFARSQGVPVRFISYAMSLIVALAIVFSIRSVGIVLLISLLTIPAVVVNSLTHNYRRIAVWAVVVAVAGNIAGLWLSYKFDIPAGAATIFVLALTLIIVKLLPLLRTKKCNRTA